MSPGFPQSRQDLKNHIRVQRTALELFASEEVNLNALKVLRKQGVKLDAVQDRCGPICLRRIFVEDGAGLFEFDDELGEPAFVMAVHGTDAETVVDLVAWPIRWPEVFGTFFNFAGILGADAVVDPASFIEEPCPIWASPLAWLQSGLRGCVVLEPRLAATILRQAHGFFQCESREHAKWLVEGGAVAATNLKIPKSRAAA